jgi:predicted nucleotidyltransferase
MATRRTEQLRVLAQRVADALPADTVEEVVLTGSVSRGVADEVSDIEMLIVTRDVLELDQCFALARQAGLEELDTWGAREGPARRVFGYREGVPVELVWWPENFAQNQVDLCFRLEPSATAEALAHGVSLRTTGLLEAWQERLSSYPSELAAARIENAALPWGGFAPAGVLTLLRSNDRLVLLEWLVDGADRVLTIVFALNRVWQPSTKRLAVRVAPLTVKPDRLAERIEDALTERDPRRALLVMTELQLDAVLLAPDGPNIERARTWLAPAADLLRD